MGLQSPLLESSVWVTAGRRGCFSVVQSVITQESERPCQRVILLVDVSVTMSGCHWLVFKRRGVVVWHLKVGTRVVEQRGKEHLHPLYDILPGLCYFPRMQLSLSMSFSGFIHLYIRKFSMADTYPSYLLLSPLAPLLSSFCPRHPAVLKLIISLWLPVSATRPEESPVEPNN